VIMETGRGKKKNEGHVTREPNVKTFCALENQREKQHALRTNVHTWSTVCTSYIHSWKLKQENRHEKALMSERDRERGENEREISDLERQREKMRERKENSTHRWSVKRDAETRERSGREEKGKEKKNHNFPSFSPFSPGETINKFS